MLENDSFYCTLNKDLMPIIVFSPGQPVLTAAALLRRKTANVLHILCLGDVVGRAGRHALRDHLPGIKEAWAVDMVIANGENAAGGVGLTRETAEELFRAGVDVITSGNHIWKHRAFLPHLGREPRILRPANYPGKAPGRGLYTHDLPCGTRVAVMNLLGRTFMEAVDCPFRKADELLAGLPDDVRVRVVDFHAETTSEKRAMAHFLNGRVSAVLGTHTHVQTADARVSPEGTASLTDLGMCGVEETSVLGVAVKPVLGRFLTGMPHPFTPAKGRAGINGALAAVEKNSGKALFLGMVRATVPEACVADAAGT